MLPLAGQFGLLIVAILIIMAQTVVYSILEKDIVVFDGECTIEHNVNENTGKLLKVYGDCGDAGTRGMTSQQEINYLLALTKQQESTMLCKKTESEYLKDIKWKCEVNTND
jgi:hypothetical protein